MSLEIELSNALKVLRNGGTILYPTDTVWGIGCDATNEKAADKIFAIKQRIESKSLIALVSDPGMLNRFIKDVPEMAWDLIDASDSEEDDEPTKPITIVYDAARGIAKNVLAPDGSIGIRMVKRTANDFCHRLIHKFGKPIISTSANISGAPTPQVFAEISQDIITKVDYVVKLPTADFGSRTPSSIIKLKSNGEFIIIRE